MKSDAEWIRFSMKIIRKECPVIRGRFQVSCALEELNQELSGTKIMTLTEMNSCMRSGLKLVRYLISDEMSTIITTLLCANNMAERC